MATSPSRLKPLQCPNRRTQRRVEHRRSGRGNDGIDRKQRETQAWNSEKGFLAPVETSDDGESQQVEMA